MNCISVYLLTGKEGREQTRPSNGRDTICSQQKQNSCSWAPFTTSVMFWLSAFGKLLGVLSVCMEMGKTMVSENAQHKSHSTTQWPCMATTAFPVLPLFQNRVSCKPNITKIITLHFLVKCANTCFMM